MASTETKHAIVVRAESHRGREFVATYIDGDLKHRAARRHAASAIENAEGFLRRSLEMSSTREVQVIIDPSLR